MNDQADPYNGAIDVYLERMRANYEAGDRESLFYAIDMCFRVGWQVPLWARRAFHEGWDRYQCAMPGLGDKAGKSTLGGAFGIVRPPNFKPAAERRRQCASLVWQFVEQRRKAGRAVDKALFEEAAQHVGKDLVSNIATTFGVELPEQERRGISASTAEEWYYGYRADLEKLQKTPR